ncbi:MAG TPA: transglutaminase-like domain-containing protein, partial [Ferruginibacter sp.]|nr:transglutaminase-like domain-containing protein [Ferruginibacter sp.]
MAKLLLIFFISISLLSPAFAQKNDSNIVISNASQLYSFDYSKKENAVKVKQEMRTTYQCINYRASISIAEFYDDKTVIDEVKVYVDDSRAKNIIPKYEYYSIDNIFYSDAHVCYFDLRLEKKGSTSEVYFEKTITDPRYFTSIYFNNDYNINNKTISLTIPKWMKVELKEMNFEGKDIKKSIAFNSKEDADIITYTVKDLAAWKRENNSPGATYTEPHILVLCKYADLPEGKITYFNTLDDQYAWYRSLTQSPDNNKALLKAKALEITEGVTGDIEKIKKVFYWMHDNIRYIAFEDGIAGFKPEKADVVLRKKYGDCKGMAHLTKELLNALGFDARLCWIGTNHIAYDYSTPSLAVDNHMITALLYQGKTYFLDATESYLGFNEYAERIQGRQVLIENGDKYIYTKVPATTYLQNTDVEKLSLSIKGTNLEGTVSREWKGEEKG